MPAVPKPLTGSLAFGTDGALYVSGGDGASFNFADWGQDGSPLNPCGGPPGGVGATLTPPTAEGGALRSQDLRTTADPTSLDGVLLRVDPTTGAGLPNNPLSASSDPNARRIVAHGLRNPFRMTIRPGTSEPWIADVGWSTWEEINRVPDSLGSVENFGWPCYEGAGPQPRYDSANLNICETLYSQPGAVISPYYTYNHSAKVVAGETCATGSSSTAGLAFYPGGPYPDSYDGALFFSDYSRDCIWVMFAGTNGLPDPATRATFAAGGANPVDVKIGPDGKLYYVDFDGGTIRRVEYLGTNQPPVASASANPTNGAAPLAVTFNGSGSSDPEGGPLTYAWDLDGDGAFDDASTVQPGYTYTQPGSYTAKLRAPTTSGPPRRARPSRSPRATRRPWRRSRRPRPGRRGRSETRSRSPEARPTGNSGRSLPRRSPGSSSCSTVRRMAPASDSDLVRRLERVVQRSRPRVPLIPRASTERDGRQRRRRHKDPHTQPSNGRPHVPELALGAPADRRHRERDDTVHSNGHRGIGEFDRRRLTQTLNGTQHYFSSWSDGGVATHNIVASAAATYTATYVTGADLRMTHTGSISGTTATWTLGVSNLGPQTAQNAVVTDTLPSRLVFGSAPGCIYNSGTRVVSCTLAALAAAGSATFTLTTTVTGKGGGWITNTAQVTSGTLDPNTTNNSASARVRK